MGLFVNKWDIMFILRYIYVSFITWGYVHSMLEYLHRYNVNFFTLKKLDILT